MQRWSDSKEAFGPISLKELLHYFSAFQQGLATLGACKGPSRLGSIAGILTLGLGAESASAVVGGTREWEAAKPHDFLLGQMEPSLHLTLSGFSFGATTYQTARSP